MTLNECFERRQLRLIPPDNLKAAKSLETAKAKLSEARELMGAGFGKMAVVVAYASMFHSCRALLYRDGVQEKSHFCLIEYAREKYAKTGKLPFELITTMDAFREERHDAMYGFDEPETTKEHAKAALETAEKLANAVEKILPKTR
ncbi:MAG: HEPN domain-containing protein [Candidatus Micrarchaeia archaeon]